MNGDPIRKGEIACPMVMLVVAYSLPPALSTRLARIDYAEHHTGCMRLSTVHKLHSRQECRGYGYRYGNGKANQRRQSAP